MKTFTIIWKTTVNYLKGSSLSGVSHAANSRSLVQCSYWLVIFTAGLVMTVMSIKDLMDDYYSYPVVTSSDLKHETSIYFPAVTVCNLNR